MNQKTDQQARTVTDHEDWLERDLQWVLPQITKLKQLDGTAAITGQTASFDDAINKAVDLINQSQAPLIAGLSKLTIEAQQQAVGLADKMRGRLMAHTGKAGSPCESSVIQSATLGEFRQIDLLIRVQLSHDASQWCDHLVQRLDDLSIVDIDGSLESVIALRQLLTGQMSKNSQAKIGTNSDTRMAIACHGIQQVQRIAVALGPDVDSRVESQWHKLAASIQQQHRMAVLRFPSSSAANARGALEVVAWQTGLALGHGIDFSDGAPRPMGSGFNIASCDLLINTAVEHDQLYANQNLKRITIGPNIDPHAQVSFQTPGLVTGLAARIMRFDGIILWLCQDPSSSPVDPTVQLLQELIYRHD
jgi:hypothetical protein